MDEVRKSLTKQEQIVLADFWENKELLHALQKALSHRQFNIARDTMASAPNWENVLQQRGEILGSKWIVLFLEDNFKNVRKAQDQSNNDKSA